MTAVPKIRLREVRFSVLPTATRFPFRYGIASMTEAPHWFVRCQLEVDGRPAAGITSEGLPPKWFTKNPQTSFEEDDLPAMKRVIRQAAEFALAIDRELPFFEFWQALKQQQDAWAASQGLAPLLAQLGVALIERTTLDALCRGRKTPLHQVVRQNLLGIRLGEIHAELAGQTVQELFVAAPRRSVFVRHTIGLADPLTDAEIAEADKTDDGLPHSLVSNIRAYGLRYFKLKLSGDLQNDRRRLRDLAAIFASEAPADYRITVDGNEQYEGIEEFRDHYAAHRADPQVAPLLEHLLFVEQPVHRDFALSDEVRRGFADWSDAPPVIIDESDGRVEDLPRALEAGYRGTSHKNCKGVVKSLANRALIDRRGGLLSGEDLANLGPVALLQDLAVAALLGIEHVERNGHHFFAGLSMFPEELQRRVLAAHPDLYAAGEQGFPALQIDDGKVSTDSINQSPFGVALECEEFADKAWLREE